jgi:prepilin-type N-terminal cleavage/methylation domain-containing protein
MKRNKRTGFTLVEIMIVVLIIGILLAIAVPNFIKARQNSRLQTIVSNLRQIETGKEQWAMELGKTSTDVPVQADLVPTYMKKWPTGPVTGVYLANAVNADPSFAGKTADEWRADPSGL